jgi:predicted dehydrogenase
MSDNINKKVLLVGAGPMAADHFAVLRALGCNVVVCGRSISSAQSFEAKTGFNVAHTDLRSCLDIEKGFDAAIIAVGMEQLGPATELVLQAGIPNVLVEKPAGMNISEIRQISEKAAGLNATVSVAYNRRFYASVSEALRIIASDGGLTSVHFEFTEWAHTIEPLTKFPGVKENWLLANSSHVIDLAFFFAGEPEKFSSYAAGSLSWHPRSVFTGAGITTKNVLFSYNANWDAPGRWGLELLTKSSRLILRPLEGLLLQKKGSVAIEPVALNDEQDRKFKPGLYEQNLAFLTGRNERLKNIAEQRASAELYAAIAEGNSVG